MKLYEPLESIIHVAIIHTTHNYRDTARRFLRLQPVWMLMQRCLSTYSNSYIIHNVLRIVQPNPRGHRPTTGDNRTQRVRKARLEERSHGESVDPERIKPISQVSQESICCWINYDHYIRILLGYIRTPPLSVIKIIFGFILCICK